MLPEQSSTDQSTARDKNPTPRLVITSEIWKGQVGLVLWEELLLSHTTYYSHMFVIAYTLKGQVNVFAGKVKIVSHSSCRKSAILEYFCLVYIQ